MKTNDLKRGDVVRLRNGWYAEIADNMKGNTRLAKVYGYETEIGSVYSHDIVMAYRGAKSVRSLSSDLDVEMVVIEHTPAQLKLRSQVAVFGF